MTLSALERAIRGVCAELESSADGELTDSAILSLFEELTRTGGLAATCLRSASLLCCEPQVPLSEIESVKAVLSTLAESTGPVGSMVEETSAAVKFGRQELAVRSMKAAIRCAQSPSYEVFNRMLRDFRAAHLHGKIHQESVANFWMGWLEDTVSLSGAMNASVELSSLVEVLDTQRPEPWKTWKWEATVDDSAVYRVSMTNVESGRLGPTVATATLQHSARVMKIELRSEDAKPLGRARSLYFAQFLILREFTNDYYRGRYDSLEVREGSRSWIIDV